jgi:hypothetical protein
MEHYSVKKNGISIYRKMNVTDIIMLSMVSNLRKTNTSLFTHMPNLGLNNNNNNVVQF